MTSLKNIIFLLVGIVLGALSTYLIINSNNGKFTINKNETGDSVDYEDYSTDCSLFDIKSSLNEYIEFYINDDDFYVLSDPLIKYKGDCMWHIKIVRQSRQFNEIQHTSFIQCTINGDTIHWTSLK